MTSPEFNRIAEPERSIVERHLQEKPVRLGTLADELGIDVKLSALGRGQSGLIESKDGRYTIKINRHETRERQRFTLAFYTVTSSTQMVKFETTCFTDRVSPSGSSMKLIV